MDKTITLEPNKEEAEQLSVLLDQWHAAMDHALEQTAKNHQEIDRSQARTWAILADIQRSLNVEKDAWPSLEDVELRRADAGQ